MFNRYTLPQPIIVPSGKPFVKVSQRLRTSPDRVRNPGGVEGILPNA